MTAISGRFNSIFPTENLLDQARAFMPWSFRGPVNPKGLEASLLGFTSKQLKAVVT